MNLDSRNFTRWFIIVSSLIIIALVLWNTSIFFEQIKENERKKMQIWTQAFLEIKQNNDLGPLVLPIINSNTTTPMIVHSVRDDYYQTTNIPPEKIETREEIIKLAEDFKSEYEPIQIDLEGEPFVIVYYGNSSILNNIKYFPVAVILIIGLFVVIVYYFYDTSKANEQSKLWAGMAKETAHQIGTPLSSLVGWTEILKREKINPSYIVEIEKDVDRLRVITERFSKIGSIPEMKKTDIVEATKNAYDYLKSRSSTLIEFSIDLPENPVYVNLNDQLYSWTIENLVSNAIDAMRGKGKLQIELVRSGDWVRILVSDTGKGIPSNRFNKIFTPGYTSKKRGWGLGLSLVKRIIEEYHKGKVRVLKSEPGKGTIFEIRLKKI
ncbi:MAG TPA: HAMP domain-containing sensor histidine kinase [Flavobacteriaceae bacterium]|nr:HAMP domain-containing sensor histidine kinase [Flavobacteriaceae bacterium]